MKKLVGLIFEVDKGYVPTIGYEVDYELPSASFFHPVAKISPLELLSEAREVLQNETSITEKLLTPVKKTDCTHAGVLWMHAIRKLQN